MTDLDKHILGSLWRWKLLTTAALAELHFQKLTPSYAHRRLLNLKAKNLIQWVYLDGRHGRDFAWALTNKGYGIVQPSLPTLKQEGFRSEAVAHDHLVTAIHLGDWLSGLPKGCDVFTEQELRRFHVEHYPDWIPRSNIRRPDGYWRTIVDGEPATVALEVEMSQKTDSEYRETVQFYSVRRSLLRVVWVVLYPSIGKAILNAINDIKGDGMRLHDFILLKDFLAQGWGSKFFLGRDVGVPLTRLLHVPSGISARHVGTTLLLNKLKSPHRSPDYASFAKSRISQRVGSSLLIPFPTSTTSLKGDPTNET